MAFTTFPITTATATASLIVNVPYGFLVATNVQAAINALVDSIDATGDPLELANGLEMDALNSTFGSDVNLRVPIRFRASYSTIKDQPSLFNVGTGFTTAAVQHLELFNLYGDNTYSSDTQAKTSWTTTLKSVTSVGAGQRFTDIATLHAYGMGDAFIGSYRVNYGCGDVDGDEGVGFWSASYLEQLDENCLATIAAVDHPTYATTTTQAITASKDPQTVNVVAASGIGITAGAWVIVEQQAPNSTMNIEAVRISASTATSITGTFRLNHDNATTITAPLILNLSGVPQFGQQRVLVNLSGTTYSTGTILSTSGAAINGQGGMTWSTTMIGGTATNIGAIQFDADTYAGSPFNGGPVGPPISYNSPLRSWYQIASVTDADTLVVWKTSIAGDNAYHGLTTAGDTYSIRPAARILAFDSNFVICETTAHTWTAGDQVECAICPYSDIEGFEFIYAHYNPGATLRSGMTFKNSGARTYDVCVKTDSAMATGGNADTVGWDIAIQAGACNTGVKIYAAEKGIEFASTGTYALKWAVTASYLSEINTADDIGLDFLMSGAAGTSGILKTRKTRQTASSLNQDTNLSLFSFQKSNLNLTGIGNTASPSIKFCGDDVVQPVYTVNYRQPNGSAGGTTAIGGGGLEFNTGGANASWSINSVGAGTDLTLITVRHDVTLTSSAGLNSNLAIANYSFIRVHPTGAFSLGGFAYPAAVQQGTILRVFCNKSFAMTLVNEDASSTAANRIKTLTGADITLRAGPSFATLIYADCDGLGTRWVVTATN